MKKTLGNAKHASFEGTQTLAPPSSELRFYSAFSVYIKLSTFYEGAAGESMHMQVGALYLSSSFFSTVTEGLKTLAIKSQIDRVENATIF